MKLTNFNTLTLDCYGTLIDWETGIYNALQPLLKEVDRTFSKDGALKLFAETESPVQTENPSLSYSGVLTLVYERLAEQFSVHVSSESIDKFSQSVRDWPAFPDSTRSLLYLKKFYKLIVLSNIDKEGFSMSNKVLAVEFDEIYTAEEIGAYKPSLTNFEYMLSELALQGISKSDILHTAQSLYHDMVPAIQMGMATCWIDRRHDQPGSGATPVVDGEVKVDIRFESLAQMVAAHQAELKRINFKQKM